MAREVRVGSDRVVVSDDGMTIDAPPMDGWRVAQHRRAAVTFEGVRYQLIGVETLGPRLLRFRLAPWRDTGLASAELVYDEAYVRARDEHDEGIAGAKRRGYALLVLYPILGFLWSDLRGRLRERYGLRSPHKLAFALQFFAILLLGTWVFTLLLPVWCWLVAIVLVIDLGARWSSSLREEVLDPYGFMEWLFRRR